jgi:hypothetical protein
MNFFKDLQSEWKIFGIVLTISVVVTVALIGFALVAKPQPQQKPALVGSVPTSEQKAGTDLAPLDVSQWQTYRNEEFGFELRYPPELVGLEDVWSRLDGGGIRFKLPNQQPQGAAAYPYIFGACSEGCFIESGEPFCEPYLGSLPYEDREVGGIPFKVGTYEVPQQRQGKTWLQVEYVGKNQDMCYAFSYGATQYEIEKDDRETIETNIARFEQILSTFRFID